MDSSNRFDPDPTSAAGDFYVESRCCMSCGVPQHVAPDLVGWVDESSRIHCYWKKQPETEAEMQQAFAIFDGQEAGCHRYAGNDPTIISRIGTNDCDQAATLGMVWGGKVTKFSKGFWKRINRRA